MVGICDSGVGGLVVYRKLKALLPRTPFIYLADQAYAPYGERSQAEIAARMKLVTQFFLDRGAAAIVIACNTATVNAVDELRATFPHLGIVGMEPAIKPAAAAADKIIVLGTNSTVRNARYRTLVDQYAAGKTVWHVGAPELVRQVEAGELDRTDLLAAKLQPLVDQGAEALVVGCSHFSFLVPAIQRQWPSLQIFDGADGVARRAAEVAAGQSSSGTDAFYSTAHPDPVRFIDPPISFEHVALLTGSRVD